MILKNATRSVLLVAAASLLGGCISLFPNADPVQLYRFGATAPQVQETASGGAGFGFCSRQQGSIVRPPVTAS